MKKIIHCWTPIILMLFFFSACANNELDGELYEKGQTKQNVLYASLESSDSKTMMVPSSSEGYKTVWGSHDCIAVYVDKSSKPSRFSLHDGEGLSVASFIGDGFGTEYYAIYPYDDALEFNGSAINLILPETQEFVNDSFGAGSFPMAASSTDGHFTFKNLCSVIKVSLYGSHIVKSIEFTSNNRSCPVSGKAHVIPGNENSLVMDAEASTSLTLLTSDIMLKPDEATDFYLVLPAQTYKGGFSITIHTNTGSMTRSTDADVTLRRSAIHALTPYVVNNEQGFDPSDFLYGAGTKESPFIIDGVSDFAYFYENIQQYEGKIRGKNGDEKDAASACYLLKSDIDLSVFCGPDTYSWTPICDYYHNNASIFSGVFDGGEHKIENLYIGPCKIGYRGLFGNVSGEIKNLSVYGIIDAPIDKSGTDINNEVIGGIAAYNSGNIHNCFNYGTLVSNSSYLGGIAGINSGTIEYCFNFGDILSGCGYVDAGVGGITGNSSNGKIINCGNYGIVQGSSAVGGIVGLAQSGTSVINCFNAGNIKPRNSFYSHVGGVVGMFSDSGSLFSNCINYGLISRGTYFDYCIPGGLCGFIGVKASNCYWLYDENEGIGEEKCAEESSVNADSWFAVNKAQLFNNEGQNRLLYLSNNGYPSLDLLSALNGWAYDHSSYELELCGWEKDKETGAPVLSRNQALQPQVIEHDLFITIPEQLEMSYFSNSANIKVLSDSQIEIESMPSWISIQLSSNSMINDLIWEDYVISVEYNPSYTPRTGEIAFRNAAGNIRRVNVSQSGKIDEGDEWRFKDFYHRSLGMKFTGTWCPNCPSTDHSLSQVEIDNPDKIILMSLHKSDEFQSDASSAIISALGITNYPTSIIDLRAKSSYQSIITQLIKEKENSYPTSTGESFASYLQENTLYVDVSVFLKDPGNYKVSVMALEDNIIGYQSGDNAGENGQYIHNNVLRLAFTNPNGDAISANSDYYVWSHTYSAQLPSGCNPDNMKVLVYVQKEYGEQRKVQNVNGADYSGLGNYYVDNCRVAKLGTKAELQFTDTPGVGTGGIEDSQSTDYSRDGVVTLLQKASVGSGIDIIITGDAFRDVDQSVFDEYANRALESFFAVEPFKSLRDRFNIYKVNAVSEDGHVSPSANTKFSVRFGSGTYVEGDSDAIFDFVDKAMNGVDFTKTLVVVLANSQTYAGTAHYWSDNSAIAYVPLQTSRAQFDMVFRHEAAGHGFGKLSDEYGGKGVAPQAWKDDFKNWQSFAYAFHENLDLDSNPASIKWSRMLHDSRYSNMLGIYEGGGTYDYGVFRPTFNSIMRCTNDYFNAPSREAIYKRIMKFSEGSSWEYDYETFVKFDNAGRDEEQSATTKGGGVQSIDRDFVPPHAPVMHKK